MRNDTSLDNGLPPKLDLRKKGLAAGGDETPSRTPYPDAPAVSGTPVVTPAAPKPVVQPNRLGSPTVPSPSASAAPAQPVVPSSGTPTLKPVIPTPIRPAVPAGSESPRPISGPKTIKLRKPPPVGIKRESADLGADPGSKRSTSRIPLPLSGGEPEFAPPGTKTIRIEPAPITDPATVDENTGKTEDAPAVSPDPKRQTSRISLESVLGSSATESDDAPRTIKLQRPAGTGSTIKVKSLKADSTPNTPEPPPLEEEAAKPDSEKKTIKVKRPSIRTSPATRESPATADAPTLFAPPVQALVPVARVHWTFILAACATLVISGVLIYVLLAQALGPNLSLTELSYGAHGTELAWPGRIRR